MLSLLSRDLHTLKPSLNLTEDSDYEDDEDIADHTEESLHLFDYLTILNDSNKVKKWLNFLEANSNDDLILMAFVNFAQNLLLVYKNSIRKYL